MRHTRIGHRNTRRFTHTHWMRSVNLMRLLPCFILTLTPHPSHAAFDYPGDAFCQPIKNDIPTCARKSLDLFYRESPETFSALTTCIAQNPDNPFPYFAAALIWFRYSEYHQRVPWPTIDRWLDRMAKRIETMAPSNTPPETLAFARAGYYGLRSLYYATMGKNYHAARQGKAMLKHIRYLEKALPDCPWSWYLRGSYEYFAASIPRILKILSFILRLPGGNRQRGLALLEAAAQVPSLVQIEAVRTLVYIYLFFEHDYPAARAWSRRLLSLYPENLTHRMFALRIALHSRDWSEANRQWRQWVVYAITNMAPFPKRTAMETRFWRARWWAHLGYDTVAESILNHLLTLPDDRPEWLNAWVRLTLAQIYDARGESARAYQIYLQLMRGKNFRGYHPLIRHRLLTHEPIPLDFTNY